MIFKVKSINAQIVCLYSVKEKCATVSIETYGGDEPKVLISNTLAQLPEDNPYKHAELNQGKKNKNKWIWDVRIYIDKNDSQLNQWYADNVLISYRILEG